MPIYVYLTSLFVLFRWPGPDHCQRTPGGSAGRGLWMSGRCLPLVLPSQKPSKCTYLLSIPWLHSGHHSFFWHLWVIYIHEHSIHLHWRVIEVTCPNQKSLLLHISIWLDIKSHYCSSDWANLSMQDNQKLVQSFYSFLHVHCKSFNNKYRFQISNKMENSGIANIFFFTKAFGRNVFCILKWNFLIFFYFP